ncbi:hypothetical protein SAMN05216236_13119 [Sedimentitalea nanhaiensis]|uniref:Uncharacterized protein n=1 Tax=Sedimentitalea nanhaiensis TaxID=999627 RepID=A0A1I7DN97_9RHOB|nr:hypothetical protein SAMN05216236_13119 [Sedimentitalea nanhaiensis]
MPATPAANHRAQLFNLLRQQQGSVTSAQPGSVRIEPNPDPQTMECLRRMATRSWELPPPPIVHSAAKPGRHDKFFRTVRA